MSQRYRSGAFSDGTAGEYAADTVKKLQAYEAMSDHEMVIFYICADVAYLRRDVDNLKVLVTQLLPGDEHEQNGSSR